MSIINCKGCGKIFNATISGNKLCPACRDLDVNNFKKVKEYLYQNKGASIPEVSDATGVSAKDIMRYLREDRLEVADQANLGIPCERCGVSIKSGRFCDHCTAEMTQILKGSIVKENQKIGFKPVSTGSASSKMFTADMRKK